MPYIAEAERRDALSRDPWGAMNTGELNFVITRIILDYLPSEPHYSDYNAVMGVLECAKLELYRRAVASYEDTKITLSGDIGYDDLPQNRRA